MEKASDYETIEFFEISSVIEKFTLREMVFDKVPVDWIFRGKRTPVAREVWIQKYIEDFGNSMPVLWEAFTRTEADTLERYLLARYGITCRRRKISIERPENCYGPLDSYHICTPGEGTMVDEPWKDDSYGLPFEVGGIYYAGSSPTWQRMRNGREFIKAFLAEMRNDVVDLGNRLAGREGMSALYRLIYDGWRVHQPGDNANGNANELSDQPIFTFTY